MENKTLSKYAELYDREKFLSLNESMSYGQYLEMVLERPALARNAFQYVFDMIMESGTSTFERYRKKHTKYHFFDDKVLPIFGLEETIQDLVDFIHGAAGSYGTEKRVLLLHGPVGSSKSTICRLLKRGLENYSRTKNGAWYTYKWVNLPFEGDDAIYLSDTCDAALNENPLKLMPMAMREEFLRDVNGKYADMASEDDKDSLYKLLCEGEINPRCKLFLNHLLKMYDGNWQKVVDDHIQVVRKCHSETDRIGVGTFQPKDEKNQDSTELTGDMNYRKIGHFGADSDPRAFDFDGEFQVANRGICEFIEMLKLDNAFLYDLLGASQEHQIKPKKFSQIVIDELIVAHSVHGDTPIPHEYNGVLDVLSIKDMANLDVSKLRVFSVNMETRNVELTEVKSVFSHDFEGDWVINKQDDDQVTTTPKHSVYNENYETFLPGVDETSNILRVEIPENLTFNKPTTERWDMFFQVKKLELTGV